MSAPTPAPGGLPPFAVRRNARARRVRLSVTPRDGLVVTLPTSAPERAATDAVRAQRAWADSALASVAERRAELAAGSDALLPDAVHFAAIGETWPVEYRHTTVGGGSVRAVPRGALLVASGDVDDADACLLALRRWRTRAAKAHLPALLGDYASRVEVEPVQVRIRVQRSRWGSCSSAGNISLNANLMFLPEPFVRLVMVHELAHLVHRDHSARFHSVLEEWYPGAGALRGEFREAWRHVPAWAMA